MALTAVSFSGQGPHTPEVHRICCVDFRPDLLSLAESVVRHRPVPARRGRNPLRPAGDLLRQPGRLARARPPRRRSSWRVTRSASWPPWWRPAPWTSATGWSWWRCAGASCTRRASGPATAAWWPARPRRRRSRRGDRPGPRAGGGQRQLAPAGGALGRQVGAARPRAAHAKELGLRAMELRRDRRLSFADDGVGGARVRRGPGGDRVLSRPGCTVISAVTAQPFEDPRARAGRGADQARCAGAR